MCYHQMVLRHVALLSRHGALYLVAYSNHRYIHIADVGMLQSCNAYGNNEQSGVHEITIHNLAIMIFNKSSRVHQLVIAIREVAS